MSSENNDAPYMGRAEKAFRDAFDRLKRGEPFNVPKGTPVSQNNVAKEAGRDPSALKKARFPSLIAEIQQWINLHAPIDVPPSPRQATLAQRRRNRDLRERIEELKAERDHALSLLVEADSKILYLTMENVRLESLLNINVTSMQDRKSKKDSP